MEACSENVRVGPAGWSYDDWKGIVYPPDMPRGLHSLTFLAQYFDTVEVNASFYRPPNPKHCENWVAKVSDNPRFLFTAKLWERFTHQRDTFPTEAEVQRFVESIMPLHEAGKLGAILVQFPWSFRRTPENRIWLSTRIYMRNCKNKKVRRSLGLVFCSSHLNGVLDSPQQLY